MAACAAPTPGSGINRHWSRPIALVVTSAIPRLRKRDNQRMENIDFDVGDDCVFCLSALTFNDKKQFDPLLAPGQACYDKDGKTEFPLSR